METNDEAKQKILFLWSDTASAVGGMASAGPPRCGGHAVNRQH